MIRSVNKEHSRDFLVFNCKICSTFALWMFLKCLHDEIQLLILFCSVLSHCDMSKGPPATQNWDTLWGSNLICHECFLHWVLFPLGSIRCKQHSFFYSHTLMSILRAMRGLSVLLKDTLTHDGAKDRTTDLPNGRHPQLFVLNSLMLNLSPLVGRIREVFVFSSFFFLIGTILVQPPMWVINFSCLQSAFFLSALFLFVSLLCKVCRGIKQ